MAVLGQTHRSDPTDWPESYWHIVGASLVDAHAEKYESC